MSLLIQADPLIRMPHDSQNEVVISIANLSKRYFVGHESVRRDGHNTLRDTIVRHAKNFGRKASDMVRGRQIIQGDEVEEFWALKDVSFDVKRGDVVGIIGRNGAGKSTLLKILSRITEPTQGRIMINGRVASLLEVGTGFHPELSGRENIFLNGAILGMTKTEIREKFNSIVEFAEIDKFLDTPVKRYSSGMYVRLAFAVAAHLDPEILIVDEVLAVGDTDFQSKCLGKMRTVASEGRTVLFVSHNLQAIERLCTRGILMQGGALLFDGPVSQACQHYMSLMTTRSAKNRLELHPRQGDARARITEFEVLDVEGRPISTIAAGEDILIRIHYLAQKAIRAPWFGFSLFTAAGVRILNTVSNDAGIEIECIEGHGIIDLHIRGLTLAVGHYLCNLAITDSRGAYCDHLTEVPLVDVVESSDLPRSRTYDQSCGVVFANCRWNVVKHS
jgi:lipopolysaccharide transport system ATP-binding protein